MHKPALINDWGALAKDKMAVAKCQDYGEDNAQARGNALLGQVYASITISWLLLTQKKQLGLINLSTYLWGYGLYRSRPLSLSFMNVSHKTDFGG